MSMEMNKALVEQAGGDERAAFEAWATHLPMDRQPLRPDLYMPQTQWAWEAWQFRAALAQPSPKCATCNGSKVVSTTDTDHNGDHIEAPCPKCGGTGEADSGGVHPWGEPVLIPCDCETEQAEAERPEVVARVVHSNPAVLGQCGPLNANDELMTVAQHAASVARWAEMFNRVEQQRDAALARVAELKTMSHNYCALLMDANAKLAELEKQEPINLQHMAVAADGELRWMTGRKIDNCELYAMPDFGQAPKLYAAPVAQAQHSVPAYVSYTTRPAESLAGIALRQLKEESRWVEIRDINAPAFPDMQSHSYYPAGTVIKLPAAAPGKSVPQAWLDVQVERRRQVEAEGWTPEHDDLYCAAELPRAAAAYILNGANDEAPAIWPFVAKWWKPRDARSNYVRAGALILAEIERLDRAAPGKEVGHE